jgi:hypothetical protein
MRSDALKMVIVLLLGCALFRGSSRAQEGGTITGFYPKADTACDFPPLENPLTILCRKKIENRYISFMGYKDVKKIFIVAITLTPIKDVRKELSLIVDYEGGRPSIGKVKSWGYIFDRNGDGKIDYMALIAGAAGFEEENFPDSFPNRTQILNRDQLEYFVGHCKLIFNHWADDNFDGTIDAAIHVDMDPDRDWVKRRLVIRSTKFNGVFDDVWAFRNQIGEEHDSVSYTGSAVPYHPLGKASGEITWQDFNEMTAILKLVNRAAKLCDIGGTGLTE